MPNLTVFVEHEIHANCQLEFPRETDYGTEYWDAFHAMFVVERPEGQSVKDWYKFQRQLG